MNPGPPPCGDSKICENKHKSYACNPRRISEKIAAISSTTKLCILTGYCDKLGLSELSLLDIARVGVDV